MNDERDWRIDLIVGGLIVALISFIFFCTYMGITDNKLWFFGAVFAFYILYA